MTVIPDHQFGIDLRLRKPAGPPNRQQVDGMVRDLLVQTGPCSPPCST